ncbi:E3 ubiquitin-protein ligase PPP1R11 [Sabethes cyaneus]|uniref:E3 ubiquitin-protein ligase PPP1R11 n=1 Tax=Sabethes cyaneus TaxID=53552 RepID=UPI00237EA717|nr:E3 ubiquitin-protein ligase PPP1R11 [Sabethes cyaneus]XP_053694790.1 E3 ubiquitin-protein ligase PPP1R11 [Sabethes cyaneus]
MSSDHPSGTRQEMITTVADSIAITETLTQDQAPGSSHAAEPPVLRLRLQKPPSSRKVQWTNGTVDNEHLNRKKSKCCCIYKKPLQFGESSSESEDECEHCFGHVELKKKNKPHAAESAEDTVDSAVEQQCEQQPAAVAESEPTDGAPTTVHGKDKPSDLKDNNLDAT